MDAKPAHLHIKPDAKPFVRHTPIPIPFYLTEAVKKSLDDDVLWGIIEPVPVGTPIDWCTVMVITTKKNESIRRTVTFNTSTYILKEKLIIIVLLHSN